MDITERKRGEERLDVRRPGMMASPACPIATCCGSGLDEILIRTRRSGEKVALLYLNLDNFKTINDTLGHDIGDDLLRSVTKRLRSSSARRGCGGAPWLR